MRSNWLRFPPHPHAMKPLIIWITVLRVLPVHHLECWGVMAAMLLSRNLYRTRRPAHSSKHRVTSASSWLSARRALDCAIIRAAITGIFVIALIPAAGLCIRILASAPNRSKENGAVHYKRAQRSFPWSALTDAFALSLFLSAMEGILSGHGFAFLSPFARSLGQRIIEIAAVAHKFLSDPRSYIL